MTRSGTPLHRFQYFYTPAVGGSKPSAPTSICDVQRHIFGDCKRAGCRQVPSVPTGVAGAGANDRRGSRTATRPSTAPPHHVWAMRRRCAAGGPGRASVTPEYSAGRASEHGAARPRRSSAENSRRIGSPSSRTRITRGGAPSHRPAGLRLNSFGVEATAQAYLDLCRDHDRLAKLTSFTRPSAPRSAMMPGSTWRPSACRRSCWRAEQGQARRDLAHRRHRRGRCAVVRRTASTATR